jgi:peroxiredoxin
MKKTLSISAAVFFVAATIAPVFAQAPAAAPAAAPAVAPAPAAPAVPLQPAATPKAAKVKVGDKAADFELPLLGGGSFKLSEVLEKNKKAVVFAVSQSACASCRTELQFLNTLVGKPNYDVVMINVDARGGEAEWEGLMKSYMGEQGLKMPVLVDPKMAVPRGFGVRVSPATIIIDKEGVIQEINLGWDAEDAKVISDKLAALK